MNDKVGDEQPQSKPIWHSPVWITAIVGLIGAFITIPDHIGNYFEKGQEIEKLRLQNIDSKQQQELSLVKETLSQQGTERIFLLRYLSKTVDDKEAKEWASEEVKRLDKLAEKQEELDAVRQRTEKLSKQLADEEGLSEKLTIELYDLSKDLRKKNLEMAKLQQEAGINTEKNDPLLFVSFYTSKLSNDIDIKIAGESWSFRCDKGVCDKVLTKAPPQTIEITAINLDYDNIIEFPKEFDYVLNVRTFGLEKTFNDAQRIDYKCSRKLKSINCELI